MTLNLPTFIPVLTLILGFSTLIFAIIKWLIDQKRTHRLSSVHVASLLEGIAEQCLLVSYDEGTWNERGGSNFGDGQNTPTAEVPEFPVFADINNVGHIRLMHLNRLLALAPIQNNISSYLSHVYEHDFGPRDGYFHDRQILYVGFGEYISRLAYNIRTDVNAVGIGSLASDTSQRLKAQLAKLIIDSGIDAVHIKEMYEKFFLPTTESYWPE